MRRLIVALLIILWAGASEGAVYYVDATGGADTNTGLATDNAWKSTSKVTGATFSAGDSVLFKRGETFKGTLSPTVLSGLTFPSSGAVGNPITIGAYGAGVAPKIHALTLITPGTAWSDFTGGLWGASIAGYDPEEVYVNGTKWTEVADTPNAANEWNWDTDVLYIYSVPDPDTAFTSPGVEVTYGIPVDTNGKNYLTIRDIEVGYTNYYGNVTISDNAIGITVDNVTSVYSLGAGIYVTANVDNLIIRNSDVTTATTYGIITNDGNTKVGSEGLIQSNTSYNNGYDGILIAGNNTVVESNTTYSNGAASAGSSGIRTINNGGLSGFGDNVVIRYNISYSNVSTSTVDGNGILLDTGADNNSVYYNVTYDNYGPGIIVFEAADAQIYNNVAYGNMQSPSHIVRAEIAIWDDVAVDRTTALVKNNIGYADNSVAVIVHTDLLNNAITITNNLWYRASGDWWTLGATSGTSLSTWNDNALVGTDLNADPLFVTAGSDFRLRSSSPAINVGVSVGLTTDYAGNPVPFLGGKVDIGAYEFQSGDPWAIGGGGRFISFPTFPHLGR